MTFDTQNFIFEIEKRPALWDMSAEDYNNRDLKNKLWREIVNLFGGTELATERDKKELGLSLQRKWKNLRDSFSREVRRLKKTKNGVGSTRKSPYIYYKQMLFLKNTITHSTGDDKAKGTSNLSNPENSTSIKSSTNKKKKSDDPDSSKELINALCKSIQRREELEKLSETDEDRMFLLSLLPELKKISEHLKFPTKMEIMNVIQKAKMGPGYSCEAPTYCQMTPVHPTYIAASSYENVTEQQFPTCIVSELNASPTISVQNTDNSNTVTAPKEEILDCFKL